MPASAKTKFIAQESLRRFFTMHPGGVYYWTFTLVDLVDKTEAERRFKPFEDKLRSQGGELLQFWEVQERGAWHVHLVTDKYLDVNQVRPWMVERGWGPQMKVRFVRAPRRWVPGEGWVLDDRQLWGLVKYLCKYLTKSFGDAAGGAAAMWGKKKVFGGSRSAMVGTTRLAWNPWVEGKPGTYLYFYGRQLFNELYGEDPTWFDLSHVIRLGYEACDYGSWDPFYTPP